MRIRAAVLEEFDRPLVVQEVELAEPGPGELDLLHDQRPAELLEHRGPDQHAPDRSQPSSRVPRA